jgi:hypothetical protein
MPPSGPPRVLLKPSVVSGELTVIEPQEQTARVKVDCPRIPKHVAPLDPPSSPDVGSPPPEQFGPASPAPPSTIRASTYEVRGPPPSPRVGSAELGEPPLQPLVSTKHATAATSTPRRTFRQSTNRAGRRGFSEHFS